MGRTKSHLIIISESRLSLYGLSQSDVHAQERLSSYGLSQTDVQHAQDGIFPKSEAWLNILWEQMRGGLLKLNE